MVNHAVVAAESTSDPIDLTGLSSFQLVRLLTRETIDNDKIYPVMQEVTHRLLSLERKNIGVKYQQRTRTLKPVVKERILDRIPEPVLDKINSVVCSQIENTRINTMAKEDSLLVLLYQMLFNYNDREMKNHTNMCYSRIGKLPRKLRAGIVAYTELALYPKRKEHREALAKDLIPTTYPERIRKITALLDGTDVRIYMPRNSEMIFEHSSWISYKFGKAGLRTQVISDIDGFFEWKSSSTK
jgi:hypothetical protein